MGKTVFYKHVFYGKAPSPLRETRLGSEPSASFILSRSLETPFHSLIRSLASLRLRTATASLTLRADEFQFELRSYNGFMLQHKCIINSLSPLS